MEEGRFHFASHKVEVDKLRAHACTHTRTNTHLQDLSDPEDILAYLNEAVENKVGCVCV